MGHVPLRSSPLIHWSQRFELQQSVSALALDLIQKSCSCQGFGDHPKPCLPLCTASLKLHQSGLSNETCSATLEVAVVLYCQSWGRLQSHQGTSSASTSPSGEATLSSAERAGTGAHGGRQSRQRPLRPSLVHFRAFHAAVGLQP